MIRVLNILSDTNIGGAGRCIIYFLKYYDRSRFHVTVALPRGSKLRPELEQLGTHVIELNGLSDKSLDCKAIQELRHVIRDVNPQVVHTHGAMSGRISAKMTGRPIVYTRHSVFPVGDLLRRNPGKWVNGRVNEFFSDEIIAVAQAAKKNLVESGISPARIQVILNGVEHVKPIPWEETAAERLRLGIGEEDFAIAIMARLEAVKGHIYLLEAADLLKRRGKRLKILIAGAGSVEKDLRRRAKEMGLEDTVIFLGFVERVDRILSLIQLQVNASFGTEATSLALLEGMSMGIPAVVSDYGGNPGVINDGENGLIFKSQSSAALAECISRIMDDENLLDHLRRGATEIFNQKFTAEIYAGNIQEVYAGLAEKGGRGQ